MKRISLALLLSFLCTAYKAQNKPTLLNSNDLRTPKLFARGSSLLIQCDSVIVFDKARHNQSLAAFNASLKNYALIRQQYDSCMLYSTEGAAKLSLLSLQLAKQVTQAVDSAGMVLHATQQNLTAATANLNAANSSLKNIEAMLEQEKKARRKRAFAWSLGGFGAGVLVTSLLALVISQ